MWARLGRAVHELDVIDYVLVGAAIVGGAGGFLLAFLHGLGGWAYQASATYFMVAVMFLALKRLGSLF